MLELEDIRGKYTLLSNNTSIDQTIKTIRQVARASSKSPMIKQVANELKYKADPLKAVFDFAYNNVVYEPDPETIQVLKTAESSLRTKKGNCADYVILMSALLQDMGIRHQYRIMQIDPESLFDHIVIVADGKVLDPVPGHEQDGTDTFENRPLQGKYNFLTPSIRYKDLNSMTKLAILGATKFSRPSRFREPIYSDSIGLLCGGSCKCKKACASAFSKDPILQAACENKCKVLKDKDAGALAQLYTTDVSSFSSSICTGILGYDSKCQKIGVTDPYAPTPTQPAPTTTDTILDTVSGFFAPSPTLYPQQPGTFQAPQQAGFDMKMMIPIVLIAGGAYLYSQKQKKEKT